MSWSGQVTVFDPAHGLDIRLGTGLHVALALALRDPIGLDAPPAEQLDEVVDLVVDDCPSTLGA